MRVLARLHKCQLPDSCAAANGGVFIQSALIPADVMTFVHFSVSARQNSAKFWGEPIFGLALNLARLASRSGERRISLIDALSMFTISAGVPIEDVQAREIRGHPFLHAL